MGSDRYTFVQMDAFVRNWERLELDDDDLRALEGMLIEDPTGAPVVRGTGGARKARYSPPSWHRGKSGATRVVYLFIVVEGLIILCNIYAKGEQDDLSPEQAEEVKAIAEWIKSRKPRHGKR